MDRRRFLDWIASGMIFGLLGAGAVFWGMSEKLQKEKDKRAEYLSYDDQVSSITRERDLEPQAFLPIEVEGPAWFEEPKQLRYDVRADAPVDVLHMTHGQFEKYQNEKEWSAIRPSSSFNTTRGTGSARLTVGFGLLVVDNTTEAIAQPPAAPNHVSARVEVWE